MNGTVDELHNTQVFTQQVTKETVANVDAHLQANADTPMPGHPSFTLKTFWPVVRPVLIFVEGTLFFKPSWHDAIKGLIAGLDAELGHKKDQGPNMPTLNA